jgi:allantoicase
MSDRGSAQLVNLADGSLGAVALWASDDFFAAKERMLARAEPVSKPCTFDEHGQWMDGWESRRRRTPGHDACIVRLASPGVIRSFDLDTRYFTGNYPPQASVDATNDANPLDPATRWTRILSPRPLKGNDHNVFACESAGVWRVLRLNIHPDGGIARLRAWGEARPENDAGAADTAAAAISRGAIGPEAAPSRDPGAVIDLFAPEHGGVALVANDQHYGSIHNLNKPGRGVNMGDGWETRRRREPGFDWVIVKLGRPGTIREVLIDTAHFKGNFPDRVSLNAAMMPDASDEGLAAISMHWPLLLPEQKLRADAEHRFAAELASLGPASHVRMNMHPDGGISRLRLYGEAVRA